MNTASRPSKQSPQTGGVVIAGAAHIDRTGWLDAPSALGCSNPGRFEDMPGGTALNIARILAALQIKPHLISLVGKDAAGDWLRDKIDSEGIATQFDGITQANTGTYTNLIEPDGSLLVAIADMAIYDDFLAANAGDVAASLTENDWLCVDTNLPPLEIDQLLKASSARKIGLTVSKAKARRLLTYAPLLDILFTNRVEASQLCGLEAASGAANEATSDAAIAAGLLELGIDTAAVSDGGNGVLVIEAGKMTCLPVQPVDQVIDVTGAGDALVGASLLALTQGGNLVNAVELGIQAAGATIQHKGALCPDLVTQLNLSGSKPAI